MSLVHRHHVEHIPLGWTSSMNLFSLIFALLLALAFIVLLMLFIEVMQKDRRPREAPAAPTRASLRVGVERWSQEPRPAMVFQPSCRTGRTCDPNTQR